MEGGQEVLKRESMGRRFKGELRDLVERIHSTEVCKVMSQQFRVPITKELMRVKVAWFVQSRRYEGSVDVRGLRTW